jgi:hypothetical protein
LFPGYWCQKTEAFWQATCAIAPAGSVGVTATWGANLLAAEWQEIVKGALTPSEDPARGLKLFKESQKLKELCAAMGLNPAASLKYALHRLGKIPGAATRGGGLLPDSAEFPEMEAFLRKNFSLQVRGTNDIDKADFGSRKP